MIALVTNIDIFLKTIEGGLNYPQTYAIYKKPVLAIIAICTDIAKMSTLTRFVFNFSTDKNSLPFLVQKVHFQCRKKSVWAYSLQFS